MTIDGSCVGTAPATYAIGGSAIESKGREIDAAIAELRASLAKGG